MIMLLKPLLHSIEFDSNFACMYVINATTEDNGRDKNGTWADFPPRYSMCCRTEWSVGSNATQGTETCPRLFCVCVLMYVGSGSERMRCTGALCSGEREELNTNNNNNNNN